MVLGNPFALLGLLGLMSSSADPIATRVSYREPGPRPPRPAPEPRQIEHIFTPKPLTKRQRRRAKGRGK